MLLGVIADDFTGASDIANTLAKGVGAQGGLRTTQYLGVPRYNAASTVEAGVISLKSRSIAVKEAIDQSLQAFAWLKAQGCRQFVFKYCSTFDSTREGNIGPVGEAIARELGVRGVVACPSFPTMGRTVYQGHLFVEDRLLNESGMEKHPLNPMTDANLRRCLSYQCREPVGFVNWTAVAQGPAVVRHALDQCARAGQRLVVVDAIRDEDLIAIGRACHDIPFLTGGSGIALGLPENFIEAGLATGGGSAFQGIGGPEALLAGSCSGATLNQIKCHAESHPTLAIDVDQAVKGHIRPSEVVAFMRSHEGQAPLAYSSNTPEQVKAIQEAYGRENVANKLDRLFAQIAQLLVASGVRRLVVAGGETSGAVVSALDLGELTLGPEIDPGVPVLFTEKRGLALALKSGNFGSPDFFVKALEELQGGA